MVLTEDVVVTAAREDLAKWEDNVGRTAIRPLDMAVGEETVAMLGMVARVAMAAMEADSRSTHQERLFFTTRHRAST